MHFVLTIFLAMSSPLFLNCNIIDNLAYFWDNKVAFRRGEFMYQDRIVLTSKDILEKDFKIDTRGYRPQEVDRFLDTIIKDYDEMNSIIQEVSQDKKDLLEDNIRLKQEIRNLKTKVEILTE